MAYRTAPRLGCQSGEPRGRHRPVKSGLKTANVWILRPLVLWSLVLRTLFVRCSCESFGACVNRPSILPSQTPGAFLSLPLFSSSLELPSPLSNSLLSSGKSLKSSVENRTSLRYLYTRNKRISLASGVIPGPNSGMRGMAYRTAPRLGCQLGEPRGRHRPVKSGSKTALVWILRSLLLRTLFVRCFCVSSGACIDVDETMVVSDLSEGCSSGNEGGDDDELLAEPMRGVRNGALPPFVNKLYNMVCNKGTDSIISWVPNLNVSEGAKSFAIWNFDEFINNVLPLMSKSKNFDSFITQLNNYGFKKMSWDCREYAHEWFQEGKPHWLKNVQRRRKQTISESEKLHREIKRLESASKEQDNELNTFKSYVDNTISNHKRILQPWQGLLNRPSITTIKCQEQEINGTRTINPNWV
ncbi:winged helix-turn-helix DNA-binding domain, Heat shock transcription factor family [Artemisia annua]|uniref:Winged helix-turn-helix DNA-binding domain, Heat shock transcription factor family n=1 Tax=Artemisia annua TaxID=35608 RepID=A0A2U1N6Q2_ARTAN|nr:winged helix-turn-helix DNA-binding domain, Heat shock transcription factor family [Artemisia annua]